jgi:hypothetical protein
VRWGACHAGVLDGQGYPCNDADRSTGTPVRTPTEALIQSTFLLFTGYQSMQTSLAHRRSKLARRFSWLVVVGMTTAAVFGPSGSVVAASDKVEITICHATSSDNNPYVQNSPSIDSTGFLHGGHSDHLGPVWFPGIDGDWGDIIPPYDFGEFHYNGLNWDAAGQAIWRNGCNSPTPSPTPTPEQTPSPTPTPEQTPSPTPTPEQTPSPTPTPEQTPSPTPTPEQTPSPTPTPTPREQPTPTPTPDPTPTPTPVPTPSPTPQESPTPTGSVLSEVGTPQITLPPTDTLSANTGAPTGENWRLILLAMAGILATTLVLTPVRAPARRKDR